MLGQRHGSSTAPAAQTGCVCYNRDAARTGCVLPRRTVHYNGDTASRHGGLRACPRQFCAMFIDMVMKCVFRVPFNCKRC